MELIKKKVVSMVPPLSLMDETVDEITAPIECLSKLSQITNTEIGILRSIILAPTPSIHRLLYRLMVSHLQSNVHRSYERHRSSPVLTCGLDRMRETTGIVAAPSNDVLLTMKNYVLLNKCYVSRTNDEYSSIMLNGKTTDKRVIFKCNDIESTGTTSVSFLADEESSGVAQAILAYLERNFGLVTQSG